MNAMVVDASVVAAALFPERHSEAARALLVSDTTLHAPDLIYPEVANVIWKRHGRREIDDTEAFDLLTDVMALPLEITPCDQLVGVALELALRTRQTTYDCLYVALAVMLKTRMLSDDKRLIDTLAHGPLGERVTWLGESR